MNKNILTLTVFASLILTSCSKEKNTKEIHFATSAVYPPFEYMVQGEMKGFDLDLATLIGEKLGKKVVFENMQFSSVLPALSSGQVDAAISTITITPARQKNIDFSIPYYYEAMSLVFKQDKPISDENQLANKKLGCELGSTMEVWLKKHIPLNQIVVMDNNNQAIEALKAGYVDAVLLDGTQAKIYSKKNPHLASASLTTAEDGYAIAVNKNAPLLADINQALRSIVASGELDKLKTKWLVDVTHTSFGDNK